MPILLLYPSVNAKELCLESNALLVAGSQEGLQHIVT